MALCGAASVPGFSAEKNAESTTVHNKKTAYTVPNLLRLCFLNQLWRGVERDTTSPFQQITRHQGPEPVVLPATTHQLAAKLFSPVSRWEMSINAFKRPAAAIERYSVEL
jgi:hypothetical protein